jgi:response regulator RpfG family c-di-GMP phosphodiesterase
MINTILVTDDNVLDNAILKNYLYNERYNLVSALNGQEALELIESRNIDLIILDMVMPVLDGYGFLKLFSRTEYYKEIPIIIASGIEDSKNIEEIINTYTIFDYIIKPLDHINRMILVNKIRSATQYRKMLIELKHAQKTIETLKGNRDQK